MEKWDEGEGKRVHKSKSKYKRLFKGNSEHCVVPHNTPQNNCFKTTNLKWHQICLG